MATFDPSIVLQGRPMQDPMDSYGKAMTLKSMGQQQRMQEAQFAQQEQAQQSERRLNDLYRSNTDPAGKLDRNAFMGGVASSGMGSRMPGMQQQFAELDKRSADTRKQSVETQSSALKLVSETMSRLASNPDVTHDQVIATLAQLPADLIPPERTALIVRNLPPDQAQLRRMLLQFGTTADERLKAILPMAKTIDAGSRLIPGVQSPETGAFTPAPGGPIPKEQSPDSVASNATQRRGQDAINARARESTAATMGKPFEVTGPDGVPVLVRQDKAGNISPVEGYSPKGAVEKPLPQAILKQITEARDNAATISRLNGAFKPSYAGKGVLGLGADTQMLVSGNVGVDKDAVEWWKNYRKQAELIERHALFGAALTPTEQSSWRSSDISPGMNAEVIKRNLETRTAIGNKVAETAAADSIDAGHSAKRISAIAGRGERSGPKPGDVQEGHVFTGGDPADAKNWKKK